MKAILVMLSNYFHDLAVGILFSSMILTWYLHKAHVDLGSLTLSRALVSRVVLAMRKVAWLCWAWIIIGGIIRTVNYYDYEWLPAAGRGQVAALVVKHILLAGITIAGAVIQARVTKLYLSKADIKKEGQTWV